ncbi:oxidoreductase, partial [Burkholderia pseudomallei]
SPPHLPALARVVDGAQRLSRIGRPLHVDHACAVQASYAALDVRASALRGVGPWSMEPARQASSPMREGTMGLAHTPVALRVH